MTVLVLWAALQWDARATAAGVADRARALIAEVEADAAARELVGPAVARSKQALSQAESAPTAHVAPLEETALEWAEVARDLVRASAAERASDALEQEASSLATEIARLRAAAEQTMARVGRARRDLKELEASAARGGGVATKQSAAVKAPPAAGAGAATPSASPQTPAAQPAPPAREKP